MPFPHCLPRAERIHVLNAVRARESEAHSAPDRRRLRRSSAAPIVAITASSTAVCRLLARSALIFGDSDSLVRKTSFAIEPGAEAAMDEPVGIEIAAVDLGPRRSAAMQDVAEDIQIGGLAGRGKPLDLVFIGARLEP